MPEPIIFIAHQKVKQGKAEEYKKAYQETGEWMEANKPQTAAHIAYISEDGAEARVIPIIPEASVAAGMILQTIGRLAANPDFEVA